jgi:hypothetical protein
MAPGLHSLRLCDMVLKHNGYTNLDSILNTDLALILGVEQVLQPGKVAVHVVLSVASFFNWVLLQPRITCVGVYI